MVTPRSDGDGHGCLVGALVAAVRVGKRKSARSADVHKPCRGQQPRRGPAGRPVSTAVTRCVVTAVTRLLLAAAVGTSRRSSCFEFSLVIKIDIFVLHAIRAGAGRVEGG